MNDTSAQNGFTLLELVVALAVLAVLATVSYRGMASVLGTEAHLRSDAERWEGVFLALEQMGRDASLATSAPLRDEAGQVLLRRRGEDGATGEQGLPRRVAYRLRGDTLEYVVWPPERAAAGSAAPEAHPVLRQVEAIEWRQLDSNGQWNPLPAAAGAPMPRALSAELVLAGGERLHRIFALP